MPVFSSLAAFFKRHKKKIIVATSLAISTYFIVNELVIKKFRNFQNSLKQELIFKQQIKQRFIQTQQDCYFTILALLPVLTGPIVDYLPVEIITQALKVKKQPSAANALGESSTAATLTQDNLNRLDETDSKLSVYVDKSKAELWSLLKIKTITRTLTLIYATSAMLLVTRLQLNILARRSYLEAAIQMAGVKQNPDTDPHDIYVVEQSYLSVSWWLLNRGWVNLANQIEPMVVAKFDSIKPKTEMEISEFMGMLTDIMDELPPQVMKSSLFPTAYDDLIETLMYTNPQLVDQLESPDSNFVKLINETTSIIVDNAFCLGLLKSMIHQSLATLQYNLQLNLGNAGASSLLASSGEQDTLGQMSFLDSQGAKYKLATFLAQLSVQNGAMADNNNQVADRQVEDLGELDGFISSLSGGASSSELTGNIYINTLNDSEELDDFSAGIYSNFE
ncbi:peroxisomal biogenesis factor 3 [Diutina catenulata]